MNKERNPRALPKGVNRVAFINCDVLRQHAGELLKLYPDITVEWGGWSSGGPSGTANQTTGIIKMQAPSIRNGVDYAILLHEYGHLLGSWQSSRGVRYSNPPHGRLVEECGAWVWAMENATVWTPSMGREVKRHLGQIARHAERKVRRGNTRIIPPPSHVYWKLAARG
jgi:hypothetical protein